MLCIQEELGHLSLKQGTAHPRLSPQSPPPYEAATAPHSDPSPGLQARALSPIPTAAGADCSEDSSGPSVGYRGGTTDPAGRQQGFFDGLIGCLRPVWTIIGKAATNELKGQGEYEGRTR